MILRTPKMPDWTDEHTQYAEKRVQGFSRRYPDIEVEMTITPTSHKEPYRGHISARHKHGKTWHVHGEGVTIYALIDQMLRKLKRCFI